jgi:hypothetical protein
MAEFVVAANDADRAGMDHNECMKSAWGAVWENWRRTNKGHYVRKDNPTASGPGGVHVDAPLGGGKKPKKKPNLSIDDEAGSDLEEEVVDDVRQVYRANKILKVDDSLGLVFGWAIVCKQDGEDYFDLQDDHIPEDTMIKAATDFMQNSRVGGNMHETDEYGDPVASGDIVFAMPLTADVAKAFGIETSTTGLMIAYKPADDAILQKFREGSLTGFSIGGVRGIDEEVPE